MSPKRPSSRTTRIASLTALFLAACGGQAAAPVPAAPGRVATKVPAGRAAAFPEPHLRYPIGTILERTDGRGARAIASGLAAAGGAELSVDGRRLLFTGRQDAGAPYQIWSCGLDGDGLERVVRHDGHCGRAAELPDGRIVYAGTITDRDPVYGMRSAWALFVASPGGAGTRITFGAGCDVDPAVLPDGRVVYASYESGADEMYLYTVHPDGTGAARLPGAHGGRPFAVLPRPRDDGTLTYRRTSARGAALYEVDLRAPGSPDALHGPFPAPPEESVGILPRRPPQGHLSTIERRLDHGMLLALDARVGGGGDEAGGVRLRALRPQRSLGVAPLSADGSFYARVPSDTPLLLDVLDGDGRVRGTHTTPFWVRPGEVRACVGCHHDAETAPPNRRPLAVLAACVDLLGAEAGE